MPRAHKLEDQVPLISRNGEVLERVTLHKFLGMWIQENHKCTEHVTKTVSSYFAALSALKKIRNMVPKALKKQLVEAFVLSKVDYNDMVVYPLPHYLGATLQRVQKMCASFVNKRYAKMADVIRLGWLPVKERTELHLLRRTPQKISSNLAPPPPPHSKTCCAVPELLGKCCREVPTRPRRAPGYPCVGLLGEGTVCVP